LQSLYSHIISTVQLLIVFISAIIAVKQIIHLRRDQNLKTISNLIELYNKFRDVRIKIFEDQEVRESDKSGLCNFLDEAGYVTYQLPARDQNIAIGLWAETYMRCWIKLRSFVLDKRPNSIIRDYAYFEWLASKGFEFHRRKFPKHQIHFFEYNHYREKYESLKGYEHEKDGKGLCLIGIGNKGQKDNVEFRKSETIEWEFLTPDKMRGRRMKKIGIGLILFSLFFPLILSLHTEFKGESFTLKNIRSGYVVLKKEIYYTEDEYKKIQEQWKKSFTVGEPFRNRYLEIGPLAIKEPGFTIRYIDCLTISLVLLPVGLFFMLAWTRRY
jgi:hypothetical protein